MDSFTESASPPSRGYFLHHYPEAKSLRRDVLLSISVLLLAGMFFQTRTTAPVLYILCGILLPFLFFHAYLFEIVGKEGRVTVLDRERILWPGQAIRLPRYPHFTHTIRFNGSLDVVLYVDDLEKLHDLEDYMIDVDPSELHSKCLKVTAAVDWSIGTERGIPFTAAICADQLSGALKNCVIFAIHHALFQACESHWEHVYPILQNFSKRIHEGVQSGLDLLELKGDTAPLVHMDIAGFKIEVVDKTGPLTPQS